jgi:hypothetical protein
MGSIQISIGPRLVQAVMDCSEVQARAFLAWAVNHYDHWIRAEVDRVVKCFVEEHWDDFIEDERASLHDEHWDRKLHAKRDGD